MLQSALEEIMKKDSVLITIPSRVIARDELPHHIEYPSCYIINTKPRTHSGEHWLALYYDGNKNAFFFDSYGQPPSAYRLEKFLEKTSKSWSCNRKRIQGYSSFCGYYCVLFLLFKSRNETLKFFSYFNSNYFLNDKKCTFWINKFKKN